MKLHKTLWKGSAILLISFGIFNVFNFIFQLSMARLLSIVEYGILATLFSIIYILAIFNDSVQTVITKYSSSVRDAGKLKNILVRALKKSTIVSAGLFAIYAIIAIPLTFILDIHYILLSFTGLFIFSSFLLPVNRGIMQGRKQFTSLGVNIIIESVLKLGFGLGLVFIGWGVFGAMVATVVSAIIAFVISFSSLKPILRATPKRAETPQIYQYTAPVFLASLALFLFYSVDVIIAKAFFPAEIAGYYAIASTLAKMIFVGTYPISVALFPFSADQKKKLSANAFMNALFIVSALIVIALILFALFPELIVLIFAGRYIPESAGILLLLGIATSLISFANLIITYKLSRGNTRGASYLLLFIAVEVFLLSYFSASLLQFSIAFVTASAAFLWGSVILLTE